MSALAVGVAASGVMSYYLFFSGSGNSEQNENEKQEGKKQKEIMPQTLDDFTYSNIEKTFVYLGYNEFVDCLMPLQMFYKRFPSYTLNVVKALNKVCYMYCKHLENQSLNNGIEKYAYLCNRQIQACLTTIQQLQKQCLLSGVTDKEFSEKTYEIVENLKSVRHNLVLSG